MKLLDLGLQLRKPEPKDAPALYLFKNNFAIGTLLGGFHCGLSYAEILSWIETHNARKDEVILVVAEINNDACLGHIGFYNINFRVRSAEFGILLGKQDQWGRGLGRALTKYFIEYGFLQLNLNRISLTVVEDNQRAVKLYESLGFVREGVLRSAQFKNGEYINLICYSLLRNEYEF